MENKYVIRFFYEEKHFVAIPVLATNPETVSKSIISAHQNKEGWLSFPARDKYNRILGSERITINLDKVKYFKVERVSNLYNEKFEEKDFFEMEK
ncbi:MAG: hypothetical protein Q8906_02560 [Bacillota bacterium]|nr:hypothetical protein [Bacillota bacterium]MDP4169463.1 hypothetical protein [Bacillota bacterium]